MNHKFPAVSFFTKDTKESIPCFFLFTNFSQGFMKMTEFFYIAQWKANLKNEPQKRKKYSI